MRMPWASSTKLARWVRAFAIGLGVAVVLRLATHLGSLWFYDWRYVRGPVVWDAVHDGLAVALGLASSVESASVVVCAWVLAVLLIMGRVKKLHVLRAVMAGEKLHQHRHHRRHLHRSDVRRAERPESRTKA